MGRPLSTYRLQLSKDFRFLDLKKNKNYFSKLGISHIYASPIFKAKKESKSGYDVIDPKIINEEIGGYKGFEELIHELKELDIYWIQDIVPNHMAFGSGNKPLADIFKKGKKSTFFNFFDIDWNTNIKELKGKVLAPFLGEPYVKALKNNKIKISFGKKGLAINYPGLSFPANLKSYKYILDINPELLSTGLKNLISLDLSNLVEKLCYLYTSNTDIKKSIDRIIEFINSDMDCLHSIISMQIYKLSFWKTAAEQINYRRFFTINNLICTRTQKLKVFNYLHSLVFDLCQKNYFSGLRIDHIDGLYDPAQYLKRVKKRIKNKYLIVEKILQEGESLDENFPVDGTTGYDFLNHLNGIFCKRENKDNLINIYYDFIGKKINFYELVYQKKRLILYKHMNGDLENLLQEFKKAVKLKDSSYAIKKAIGEILCLLPVYRTYLSNNYVDYKEYMEGTISKAKYKNPDLYYELDFLKKIFFQKNNSVKKFILKFQQLASPLMAKGVEDTVFYIYNPLISLNEVGGFPDSFGTSVEDFHNFNVYRQNKWPNSLNTTSTHDAKRGEDMRARINILSEIPKIWEKSVKNWEKINKDKKEKIGGNLCPDRNDEYFLYQTLIGSFPFGNFDKEKYFNRIQNYLIKAVREAKIHTQWVKPNERYEIAFNNFAKEILYDENFSLSFNKIFKTVSHYGIFNSLSQLIIKVTSPGIPDFYQGTELWDLNLVDPDNRRKVNYNKRIKYLDEILKGVNLKKLLNNKEDGKIKLYLTYKLLNQKKKFIEYFTKGKYFPFQGNGKYKGNIISFGYKLRNDFLITVAPRFLTALGPGIKFPIGKKIWKDTNIGLGKKNYDIENIITEEKLNDGNKVYIGDALKSFPVSLLLAKGV